MQLNGAENQKHLLRGRWLPKAMHLFADLGISIILRKMRLEVCWETGGRVDDGHSVNTNRQEQTL